MAAQSPITVTFNYTFDHYFERVQPKRTRRPCASDLKHLILSELTEDLLSSINSYSIIYERNRPSPSKSRGEGPMAYNDENMTIGDTLPTS